jgi:hypothetical protein
VDGGEHGSPRWLAYVDVVVDVDVVVNFDLVLVLDPVEVEVEV